MAGWLFQGSVRDRCQQSDNQLITVFSSYVAQILWDYTWELFFLRFIAEIFIGWKGLVGVFQSWGRFLLFPSKKDF